MLLKPNQIGLRLEIASHSEANEVYIIIKQVGFKIQNNFNYSAMFMAFQEHVTKSNKVIIVNNSLGEKDCMGHTVWTEVDI